jgi:glycyl-tRNA synthetase
MTVLREDGTRFTPHVVEPSFGLDRLFLATLETSYERRDKRNIFRLPRDLAPYQTSVFPLVTKDGLQEKAQEIHGQLLAAGFAAFYDEGGSIGRRYARSDEAGTPLAITIDYETLTEDTVTVRDRDSWEQVRTPVAELADRFGTYFRYEIGFDGIGQPI